MRVWGDAPGQRGIVEFREPLADNQKYEIVEWTGEVMAQLLKTYKGDARKILGFFARSSMYWLERIPPGQGA